MGTTQDNSKPLDERVRDNKAIQEVFEMLNTFTKDDRLREQYRVREAFLRDQQTAQAEMKRLKKAEKAAKEAEKKAKQAENKERSEKEQILAKYIKFMHDTGSTREKIAEALNISIDVVNSVL